MLRFSKQKPLVVYVHVPKTAGSSINHALKGWGKGLDHIERHKGDPEKFLRLADQLDWMSGHIRTAEFAKLLEGLDRPVRWFTSVREPSRHVASHYNWLIEIFHKGEEFYEGHNVHAKRISETLRASDNNDPEIVVANLKRFKNLFLNLQSRFLEDPDYEGEMDGRFEFICDDSDIDTLLARIGAGARGVPQENRSSYHFDKAVFRTPRLQAFLQEANKLDYAAYDRVRQRKTTLENAG